jgi:hypothetical protein
LNPARAPAASCARACAVASNSIALSIASLLSAARAAAEAFVTEEYLASLHLGARLPAAKRRLIAQRLSELIGISGATISLADTVISPTTLTANQTDWNPTGLSTATIVRVSADNGVREILSIAAQAGRRLLLVNVSANLVILKDAISALGTAAICTKQELLLVIIGGVFVMEAMSVILQVGSFKLRKKRIFKMSPIHHHFELLGWHENQVIIRFWLLSIMLALFGLALLKIA